MNQNTTALERAFQLAESGMCGSVDEIRKKLLREGYSQDQVTGPSLHRQLAEVIRSARPAQEAGRQPE